MKRVTRWSKKELVITLYFSSRRIGYMAVSQLLNRRGYHRTSSAVERKIRTIIGDRPSLRPSQGSWDVSAVDQWLDDVLGSTEDVNRLIDFTPEDAEVVAEHQPIEQVLWSPEELCSWRLRMKDVIFPGAPFGSSVLSPEF
ncbi:hypothetical protein KXV92_007264 [Aspergillus fumigatus]|nr:hypothetical protein KXV98_005364 [Aspergillus fumigatus]KAH3182513.1 hypothetical protein KXV92_007264 [Aspergillus fumigatus]